MRREQETADDGRQPFLMPVQPETPAGQQIVRCGAGISENPQYRRQENEQGKPHAQKRLESHPAKFFEICPPALIRAAECKIQYAEHCAADEKDVYKRQKQQIPRQNRQRYTAGQKADPQTWGSIGKTDGAVPNRSAHRHKTNIDLFNLCRLSVDSSAQPPVSYKHLHR